ncbi:MAG TPA: prepilin peptidase [bacterium]|nr:prepilin peptidase [Patescibacteria group bacterium]HOC96422.1 prepilin peptidase [bacterium]HPO11046.1 prepilin peptidase [bacterium]
MNAILIITIFLFGISIGSFLNVIVDRLANHEKITGRSKCSQCGNQLKWYDLIPIFSFLFLHGKCRYCKKKISRQYIIIESITGILITLVFLIQFRNGIIFNLRNILMFIRNIILILTSISIFLSDIKYMEIIDEIVIPGSFLILILNCIISKTIGVFLIGGIVGLIFFLLQFVASKEGWVGGGDIRIGFLIGVSFGNIYQVFLVIIFGYILGLIYSIPLLIKKYIKKQKDISSIIPLGPFLSISSIIMLFILTSNK